MELECIPMSDRPPEIVPGRSQRTWMDHFEARHPYRCLPLSMANSSGWELLCPFSFTAEWNGGKQQSDITIKPDRPVHNLSDYVASHFSHGVLTFHAGYLFRTPPGWSMWCGGAPNLPKDGIYPLSGLVETDWLPFPFTMNWIFTRPGRVKFEKGEPFCFITLTQPRALDETQPIQRSLASYPTMRGQYEAWQKHRDEFNTKLARRDPEAVKEAWQRFYFRGEMPDDTGKAPATHTNKRRLKSLKLGR